MCEALVTDHSIASGTGLMDIHALRWDAEALQLASISAEQLPELVPTTHVLSGLSVDVGLPAGTPVVVGAGDGPLANLGLGAVDPGVAAVSIGTSGAMRVMVEHPGVDPLGGVFCYALTEDRWAVGGAINNGGIVLDWAGTALAPDIGTDPEALLELAGSVPPGCGGLIMLPYLLSERAPHWSALPRGAYIGLTREHRREHLVRAAVEGVCQQLALVLHSMRAAGNEVRSIRATGGFARSQLWRQILADTLGMDVLFPAGQETGAGGTRAWLLVDDPAVQLPPPTVARTVGVVMSGLAGGGVTDHRRALVAWAEQRDAVVEDGGSGAVRVHVSDGSVRVRFEGDRIVGISTGRGGEQQPDAADGAPEEAARSVAAAPAPRDGAADLEPIEDRPEPVSARRGWLSRVLGRA